MDYLPAMSDSHKWVLTVEADLMNEVQKRLENQIRELEAMISRVSRVPAPIKKHHLQSFVDSPFSEEICMSEMPSHFIYPTMKMYDGIGDPENQIAQYKQRVHITVVHQYQRETCMRKGFGLSLAGQALQWFVNLPMARSPPFPNFTTSSSNNFPAVEKLSSGHMTRTDLTTSLRTTPRIRLKIHDKCLF